MSAASRVRHMQALDDSQPASRTPLEHYALIGDCHAAGLVGKNGSIDWLCLPRFDSEACFAALLGDHDNGRWRIAPRDKVLRVERRYRPGTLVLETDFETETGKVRIVDCMAVETAQSDVVRLVQGLEGHVDMELDLAIRFDNGKVIPWVKTRDDELQAIAGPDMLRLNTPVELSGRDHHTAAEFRVAADEQVPFVLSYHPSHHTTFDAVDPDQAVSGTEKWWQEWSERMDKAGRYTEQVRRSLVVLKALTYLPTGGVVAAPTTSIPEQIGGTRNWDYRYVWLRDATVTLSTLFRAGCVREAASFREWLLRAVAGEPSQVQIMYGIDGRRELHEFEAPWLDGYEGSQPVRIGNGAHSQLQLDVYGEIMNTMHQCRINGLENDEGWALECALLRHLEDLWQVPDQGIWEMRGPPQHFVHSKMMCWLAFDRAVEAVERFGREGPVNRWRALRDQIHAQVCDRGYDEEVGAFTQAYGSKQLDAAVLMMALVGFLPPDDPRIQSTVRVIEERLSVAPGLIKRYEIDGEVDGIGDDEGCFLPCCYWMIENLALIGQRDRARELFHRLLDLQNDMGLLSEEYDDKRGRLIGNYPQALSHLAFVDCAYCLETEDLALSR